MPGVWFVWGFRYTERCQCQCQERWVSGGVSEWVDVPALRRGVAWRYLCCWHILACWGPLARFAVTGEQSSNWNVWWWLKPRVTNKINTKFLSVWFRQKYWLISQKWSGRLCVWGACSPSVSWVLEDYSSTNKIQRQEKKTSLGDLTRYKLDRIKCRQVLAHPHASARVEPRLPWKCSNRRHDLEIFFGSGNEGFEIALFAGRRREREHLRHCGLAEGQALAIVLSLRAGRKLSAVRSCLEGRWTRRGKPDDRAVAASSGKSAWSSSADGRT